jgi:hypothetical protein
LGTEGAWYARSGNKVRELFTIIHLPYTSMVLSYLLVGAALSPTLHLDRVGWSLAAYFLGLGLSAHALNEIHARHWGVVLSENELKLLFTLPLIGAISIGVYGMYVLYHTTLVRFAPLVLCVFICLEIFFVFAYNTGLYKGRFHGDASFAFSWAALPTLVSYYVNSLEMSVTAVLMALAMAATAGIEINLSRWCKDLRRQKPLTEMRFEADTNVKMGTTELIAKPEKSLKLIVIVVDLLAISLFLGRFIP